MVATDSIFLDATAPMLQPRDLGKRLPDVVTGGVDAVLATAGAIEDFRTTMEVVGKWLEIERSGKHKIRIGRSVAEIRAAKAAGETAIVLHFQGSDPIEDELDFLNLFQASGLRVMQLTYNLRNRVGDGCFEPTDAGLSKFGTEGHPAHGGTFSRRRPLACRHAHRAGSHGSRKPPGGRHPCECPRADGYPAQPDRRFDSRRSCHRAGVIGVCAVPFFLTREGVPTLDMMIDHAVHIADLVGLSHVGLGFDFADENEDDYVYFGYDERYIPMPPWIFPSRHRQPCGGGECRTGASKPGDSARRMPAVSWERISCASSARSGAGKGSNV